jgi:hypothetical protein
MVTDLSNEIPLCHDWDPTSLHSPDQLVAPELEEYSKPDRLFGQARELAVYIPTRMDALMNSFIDNLIRVFLDTLTSRACQPHAVPLAVSLANRPHGGDGEPIVRRAILLAEKLEAEGTPAEEHIVLGWELDTHILMIRLLFDKFVAWVEDLTTHIQAVNLTFQQLETLVGRLNHAAFVFRLSRHFLGRLYRRLQKRRRKNQGIILSTAEVDDMQL